MDINLILNYSLPKLRSMIERNIMGSIYYNSQYCKLAHGANLMEKIIVVAINFKM
jgi:hypothetical protein